MANKFNTNQIISKLGYENFDYVLLENHNGWIWVLWNNYNVSAQVFFKGQRAVYLLVHDKIINKESIVSPLFWLTQEIDKDAF